MRAIREDTRSIEVSASILEFLRWLDVRERTYEETMEAWRTSCPRLSIWEDASIGGLVALVRATPTADAIVVLTECGRSIVAGSV
jgi:hypothetical protein